MSLLLRNLCCSHFSRNIFFCQGSEAEKEGKGDFGMGQKTLERVKGHTHTHVNTYETASEWFENYPKKAASMPWTRPRLALKLQVRTVTNLVRRCGLRI